MNFVCIAIGIVLTIPQHYYLPYKDRKNLSVLVDALVTRVVTEKTSDGSLLATGVEFIHIGKTHTVKVRKEAILAAG